MRACSRIAGGKSSIETACSEQPACHRSQSATCCCSTFSNGCIRLDIARVAADSALLPKPSASTARRGNSPISATLPGPAVRYCEVIWPLRLKSCQPSLLPT
jgi:hypothetical protein